MHGGNLFRSSRYKNFVSDRDKALEKIHTHAQQDISRTLFEGLDLISGFISHLALTHDVDVYRHVNKLSSKVENYTGQVFGMLLPALYERVKRMRAAVFTLTYTSELEAIGRATSKTKHLSAMDFKDKLHQAMLVPTLEGAPMNKRLWLDLMKLRGRICTAFNMGIVQELSPKELIEKVKASFPKIESYKQPPRNLRPIKEADKPGNKDDEKEMFSFDFIDESDWNLAVQAYIDTELPPSRFDNEPDVDPETGIHTYAWEMENDLTDDFVKQVRSGQVDAANELGIKDFTWIAIIDAKTCDECCLPRNGKTSTEIEKMLDDGTLDADVCDVTVPPAHMNCRCQLAPVGDVEEVEGPDWKSFQDWIDS